MTWREFEKLAAQIYAELSPTATVTHNDSIRGIDSGIDRQIDVSIRFTVAGHALLTIVQAKDYGRPADINEVGALATVLRDVRANKGIMVCRSGFTDGARKLAQNLGIDLCNLHDAESRDWSIEISLPLLWVDYTPQLQVRMVAQLDAGDSLPKDPRNWVLSSDLGQTRIQWMSSFVNAWNAGTLPRDLGSEHRVEDPSLPKVGLLVEDKRGQRTWRPVQKLALSYTVSRRCWLGAFTPSQCRGILHYESGMFTVSHLPIGEIPTKRDETWKEIADPDELAVKVPGSILTTEQWEIDGDSASIGEPYLNRMEDGT